MTRYEAVRKIRRTWPNADDIRSHPEDKCPACRRRGGMYSLVFADERRGTYRDRVGVLMERCGHYCVSCGWGNAGSRESLDDIEITASETGPDRIVAVRYQP